MTVDELNEHMAARLAQMVDLLGIIAVNTTRNDAMSEPMQIKTMQAVNAILGRKPAK